ncbi:hypothetical protein R3P38DRAFT_3175359 [Favolaschia claudopus]|uniref:Uncharacterized protein n=1 Tax=Favolaschia claudopus TaxID=2862362 RepID=A0AAW0DAD6_9AGAR
MSKSGEIVDRAEVVDIFRGDEAAGAEGMGVRRICQSKASNDVLRILQFLEWEPPPSSFSIDLSLPCIHINNTHPSSPSPRPYCSSSRLALYHPIAPPTSLSLLANLPIFCSRFRFPLLSFAPGLYERMRYPRAESIVGQPTFLRRKRKKEWMSSDLQRATDATSNSDTRPGIWMERSSNGTHSQFPSSRRTGTNGAPLWIRDTGVAVTRSWTRLVVPTSDMYRIRVTRLRDVIKLLPLRSSPCEWEVSRIGKTHGMGCRGAWETLAEVVSGRPHPRADAELASFEDLRPW